MDARVKETAPAEILDDPFYWVCGKCGGRSLYSERELYPSSDVAIVCGSCGNRYYGIAGETGIAPGKVYRMSKPIPVDRSHFTQERTANIVTVGWRPGKTQPRRHFTREREEEDMAAGKRGPCGNCQRKKFIVSKDGFCGVCHKASDGLKGEEREAALVAIKEKIDAGGIHGGRRPQSESGEKKDPQAEDLADIHAPERAFIEEMCVLDEQASMASMMRFNLYQAYTRWCAANNVKLSTSPAFYRRVCQLFKKNNVRTARKVIWGVRLKEIAQPDAPADEVKIIVQKRPEEEEQFPPAAATNGLHDAFKGSMFILTEQEVRLIKAVRSGAIAILE